MTDTISRSTYNLAPSTGRTPLESTKRPVVSAGDRVTWSAADPGWRGGPGLRQKIAQETGRALAEVVTEMIDQFRKKPGELSVHVQGPERAPRTLAVFH